MGEREIALDLPTAGQGQGQQASSGSRTQAEGERKHGGRRGGATWGLLLCLIPGVLSRETRAYRWPGLCLCAEKRHVLPASGALRPAHGEAPVDSWASVWGLWGSGSLSTGHSEGQQEAFPLCPLPPCWADDGFPDPACPSANQKGQCPPPQIPAPSLSSPGWTAPERTARSLSPGPPLLGAGSCTSVSQRGPSPPWGVCHQSA